MGSPSRRPPSGSRGNINTKAVLTWALLLSLTAAQSVQPVDIGHNLLAATRNEQPSDPSRRPSAGRSPAEIPILKHDITTVKFRSTDNENTHANKFQALAPAQEISAVRAPLAQSAEFSGLSALAPARLLQDWEVENIVLLATVDGAIHARDRKTGQERWSLGIPDSPMIQTTHHRLVNASDPDDELMEDDYIFIVEPSKDGNLYIQHKDPKIGLQRLGVTVKSLAAETPQFVDDPPVVTVAEQETKAYVVDAATGKVLQEFPRSQKFVNDEKTKSCRRLSGFELDDVACDTVGTLNLGRVQYTITISHAKTGDTMCTIKFAEWVPNKADADLQDQYVNPLDNYHIQTHHTGRIIGLEAKDDTSHRPKFTHKLEAPVARVFDVVRPVDNKDDGTQLVLLSRPTDSSILPAAQGYQDNSHHRVFVNKTESGVWYAMSESVYPGVTSGAMPARAEWHYEDSFLDFQTDLDDLIGVHMLSQETSAPVRLTISGPPPSELLPGPEQAVTTRLPAALAAHDSIVYTDWPKVTTFVFYIILIVVSLFVLGVKHRNSMMLRVQERLKKMNINVTIGASNAQPEATTTSDDQTVNMVQLEDKPVDTITEVVAEAILATPARSRATTVQTVDSPSRDVRSQDPNDNNSEGDSDQDKENQEPGAGGSSENGSKSGKKRPTRRGQRGGRKNKKKESMAPEVLDELESVVPEVPTKDGMLQVGRIKYNKMKCLGRGSNGTEVFPGSLDGREVAVKRLIRSPNSLAAKEIKHLLSSDENPHVIRYFGKEESQHFTFIALDLFRTSLDKFIEYPMEFPDLVTLSEGFDVKDTLKQITNGVQHLHSLKLVHRDIKPQNVLVKAIKSQRPLTTPKLHFVISDFGLCKPLEEGPESTFAPTANHTAAGTTGWRAPELLVHARAGVAAPLANSSTTKSSTHSNDGTVIDAPSGRRATKAIDIFSLGCVFYYVMSLGQHPFDVGGTSLGRDLNIQQDKKSTEGLRLHNYSYDADDLILQMLKHSPKDRPDTAGILSHPYFWDVADKLEFLCDVSDCYEREKNSISNIHDPIAPRTAAELDSLNELAALESLSPDVIGKSQDFLKALPRSFINEMGKQRKYTGSRMIDLLRVIRNKKNHFHDLPDDVKEMMMGGSTEGYYEFWAKRFPSLLINCHCVILERGLVERFRMERYYT